MIRQIRQLKNSNVGKKRLINIASLALFIITVAVGMIMLANQRNTAQDSTASPNNEYIISPRDELTNFPIERTSEEGPENGCNTGNNTSRTWRFSQWSNENNLCQGGSIDPTHCPNASMVRGTGTARVCYWQNTKKFDVSINSNAMSYNGCYRHRTPETLRSPGGYGTYISWSSDNPYALPPAYNIANMDNLYNSSTFQTAYFSGQRCAEDIPLDPITQTKEPIGFNYMSTIINNMDDTVIFYQLIMYDNRWENESPTTYENCGLENPGDYNWIVIGEPIMNLGMPMARPGNQPYNYEVDILPRVKHYIRSCMGADADLSTWRVLGAYWGNEAQNTVNMTTLLTNPHLKFVLKNGIPLPQPTLSPTSTPYPTNTPINTQTPTNTSIPTSTSQPSRTPIPGATFTPIPSYVPTSAAPTPTRSVQPTPIPPNIREDFNMDGKIDINDFKLFRDGYLRGNNPKIDLNNNQVYLKDIGDFAIFANRYKQYV